MKTSKNNIWNFNSKIDSQACADGVKRKILAYSDEMMCVENHFEKGAIGAMHHHPHTQITYVVSGEFEFTIDGEKKVVNHLKFSDPAGVLPIHLRPVYKIDSFSYFFLLFHRH